MKPFYKFISFYYILNYSNNNVHLYTYIYYDMHILYQTFKSLIKNLLALWIITSYNDKNKYFLFYTFIMKFA
ncbi:LOW QUALITY PROTEIN: hypothetical protein PFNF135_01330 [Plasmodium falciparum NF135/5.C10]|uniref:Uncharacterized protein n=1 Tax=Plasmodium falciparum NF135/5.C10 TaxID=1036726 RepID=W4IKS2_PLAFA|nr:LOW QUALITY PROTEIN: hypothetical protein PFNF135_01330 [Plasmodium falciparum NF135/5.C10]